MRELSRERGGLPGSHAQTWQPFFFSPIFCIMIAREFPYVVEVMLPEGGFGRRLDDMHVFHRQRGITDHHIPRRRDGMIIFVDALQTAPPLRYSRHNFPAR
jgi:hypothetical protein